MITQTKRFRMGQLTLADVRKLNFTERVRYFDKLHSLANDKGEGGYSWMVSKLLELTVPCTGEAHTNGHNDHCAVCLHTGWGRMLAPLPVEGES